jgi:hypothetical protein
MNMSVVKNTVPETEVSNQYRSVSHLRTVHVWMMAFSSGAVVANIYYIQPLLSAIAANFLPERAPEQWITTAQR